MRSKGIQIKVSQIVWYTACDKYTPDLIIGKGLIIEVDGKIHDLEYRKTPDRIRQRALENMGYSVLRVKNEQIQKSPNTIAEEIIQTYYQVIDAKEKIAKITQLKKPEYYKPVLDISSWPYCSIFLLY